MRARWLSYGMAAVVLLAAGFYVFVYLYRWEWNRAIMAGVIFLAAEVALVAALIGDRLKGIEERIRDVSQDAYEDALDDLRKTAPAERRHFAWMSDGDNMSVFVPVLMGAGVVISGLAWVVERLATKTARPVLEARLAAKLVPLSLPAGGLSNNAAVAPPAAYQGGWRTTTTRAVVVLVLGALMAVSVDVLGDLTQNRPDAVVGGTSVIVLEVESRDEDLGSTAAVGGTLWAVCRGMVASELHSLERVGSGRVAIEVAPRLGTHSIRRLHGHLEDGTVDGVSASVVEPD